MRLVGNAVDPVPLTVSVEKVADGQFKVVVPTGAPFEIVLPLTVTNGSISGGVTTVTIPVGSVKSEVLTVYPHPWHNICCCCRCRTVTYATPESLG